MSEEAKSPCPYADGLEEYPLGFVAGQNLLYLVYFAVGFLGMSSLRLGGYPVVSLAYVAFLAVMLLVVLRKHICTHCYYYGKRCGTGWGRLAALLFARGSGNYRLGVKLAAVTWMVATVVPVVGTAFALVLHYSPSKLALLGVFLLLTPAVLLFHRASCASCRVRNVCPASMVRSG